MRFEESLELLRKVYADDPVEDERISYLRSLHAYATMVPKPCTVVEIGTYRGRSAFIMACALAGTGSDLVTIDPVFAMGRIRVPDAHQTAHEYASDFATVWHRFYQATLLPGQIRLRVIPKYSHDYLKSWDRTPIGLLYVDGEHTSDAVRRDLGWMHHVGPGGYAAWDDWIKAVQEPVEGYVAEHPEWEFLHKSTDPPRGEWSITLLRKRT